MNLLKAVLDTMDTCTTFWRQNAIMAKSKNAKHHFQFIQNKYMHHQAIDSHYARQTAVKSCYPIDLRMRVLTDLYTPCNRHSRPFREKNSFPDHCKPDIHRNTSQPTTVIAHIRGIVYLYVLELL